ncbi:hypothetical protein HPB47_014743 [Ixodes persulcatus]|uniref:Uncharacterized protein n=1 Tax=Ixodes persulcatus TaxID=34615 RepID=A0AC60QV99_IXOPE|nr:hypothetical protein HPB47_014743 [Ixodes persulcatus]
MDQKEDVSGECTMSLSWRDECSEESTELLSKGSTYVDGPGRFYVVIDTFFYQRQEDTSDVPDLSRLATDMFNKNQECSDLPGLLNVDCKVFTSFWHYVLMANYCWILMEGLYLHSLVFLAFFTDSSGIIRYVALGWVSTTATSWRCVSARQRLHRSTPKCRLIEGSQLFGFVHYADTPSDDYETGHQPTAAPTAKAARALCSEVNFVLFINITRVLFVKLFTTQTHQARKYRYRKWFKSTLVLVPLFGAHYAFLLGMSLAAAGDLLELVWLYIDQLFSSFQGFLVATLYCFLNAEVGAAARAAMARHRRTCCSDGLPLRVNKAQGSGCNEPRVRLSLLTRSLTLITRLEERPVPAKQDFDIQKPYKVYRESLQGP